MGRFIIGAFFGAIITVALAWIMRELIITEFVPPAEPEETVVITITREIREPAEPLPPGPVRPSDEDQPPPPPTMPVDVERPGDLPMEPMEIDPTPEGPIQVNIVRILSPLVRVPPQYPQREQGSGIEGHAVLEFCVTSSGQTANIEVIESVPTSGFGRASERAIADWIYDAQTDDAGNPINVCGQRARLDFNLEGGAE